MAIWRLLGDLPQARTQEEIRAQSIDGWNPWSLTWSPSDEPPIAVPHPENPSRFCHVWVSESGSAGATAKFAALPLENRWYFYVPAAKEDQGAFEARRVKLEGFWRARFDEESELPWPVPVEVWADRVAFLQSLIFKEAIADRIAYRGYSLCRMCGRRNGSESLQLAEWEWPAGFRHYVEEHFVRPSEEFVMFIMASAE